MESKIDVVVLVDVVGALSDMTLHNGNLSMMDDGRFHSTGQGTPNLCTMCQPGQIIQWSVTAVDLQTPVEIRSITFLESEPGSEPGGGAPGHDGPDESESEKLGLNVWSGIAPPWMVPDKPYTYRLELQMYEGANSIMHVDSCSLKRPAL